MFSGNRPSITALDFPVDNIDNDDEGEEVEEEDVRNLMILYPVCVKSTINGSRYRMMALPVPYRDVMVALDIQRLHNRYGPSGITISGPSWTVDVVPAAADDDDDDDDDSFLRVLVVILDVEALVIREVERKGSSGISTSSSASASAS
jgi:hypothetical protein